MQRGKIAAGVAAALIFCTPLAANAQESPGQFVEDPAYSTTATIWNFWNTSKQVGSTATLPQTVKFSGVMWRSDTYTYNTSYPGTHQVYLCSVSPDRCFNVTGVQEGWTDQFNDLPVTNTKFVLVYRYYSAKHPDGGPIYDPLVGSSIKPLLRGSLGAWWTPPTTTGAAPNMPRSSSAEPSHISGSETPS